jgi:hypothetical protein
MMTASFAKTRGQNTCSADFTDSSIVLGIVRVLFLNRHETWGRIIFALSSDKGFEEVSHNVKKYSSFADTAEN